MNSIILTVDINQYNQAYFPLYAEPIKPQYSLIFESYPKKVDLLERL